MSYRVFFLLFLLGLGAGWLAAPALSFAQHDDLLAVEACRDDPQSEACICYEVPEIGFLPIHYKVAGDGSFELDSNGRQIPMDYDVDGIPMEFHGPPPVGGSVHRGVLDDWGMWWEPATTGRWYGTVAPFNSDSEDYDLRATRVEDYKAFCAVSYLRENLRRAWLFCVAVGGLLLTVSLIWGGFAYMQDATAGVDLARSRVRIFRIILGIVLLGAAFLIWEAIGEVLFPFMEYWSGDRNVFYSFNPP